MIVKNQGKKRERAEIKSKDFMSAGSVLHIFRNFIPPFLVRTLKTADLGNFVQPSKLFHPLPKTREDKGRPGTQSRQGTLRFTNWFCSGRMKATRIPSSVAATGGDRNMTRMCLRGARSWGDRNPLGNFESWRINLDESHTHMICIYIYMYI